MLDSWFAGAWRSLVAHQSGGLVVVGSNPAAPTIFQRLEAFGTIVATGRDIPEAEVAARFDGIPNEGSIRGRCIDRAAAGAAASPVLGPSLRNGAHDTGAN